MPRNSLDEMCKTEQETIANISRKKMSRKAESGKDYRPFYDLFTILMPPFERGCYLRGAAILAAGCCACRW